MLLAQGEARGRGRQKHPVREEEEACLGAEGSTAFQAWQEVKASFNKQRWRDTELGNSPAFPKLMSPVTLGCVCFSFSFFGPQP